MPKRAVFERSRREFSLDVSVGIHILFVEQSSLESQSRGCVPTLRYLLYTKFDSTVDEGKGRLNPSRDKK